MYMLMSWGKAWSAAIRPSPSNRVNISKNGEHIELERATQIAKRYLHRTDHS